MISSANIKKKNRHIVLNRFIFPVEETLIVIRKHSPHKIAISAVEIYKVINIYINYKIMHLRLFPLLSNLEGRERERRESGIKRDRER